MSYKVKFTNYINKGEITVNDSTVNSETNLTFPGRNYKGYAVSIAENFLHLLENFASTTAPDKPIEGQIWYDANEDVAELKVYDGTAWKSAGSVKKGESEPDVANSLTGDLWVDTDNQQLFLYTGTSWILVGPTFSSGLKTGPVAETVIDTENQEQVVLKNYINDKVISIYSIKAFTPKQAIDGFEVIHSGFNLSQKDFSSNGIPNRYYGIAEKAESLVIGNNTVGGSNFLRKDTSNVTNYIFNVRNDSGITVGQEGQFKISVDGAQEGSIYHSTPNSAMNLKVNKEGTITTVLHIDSNGRVGVGNNVTTPQETLDVDGSARFTDFVLIQNEDNVVSDFTGSLQVSGGTYVAKDLLVGGNTTLEGNLSLGGSLYSGSSITANSLTANTVTASTFVGNLQGNVTGTFTGSAVSLRGSTQFTMSGDVTSSGFSFDGSTQLVSAGAFVIGNKYKIVSLKEGAGATTNFTAIGAASNTVGLIFTATGVGTGTGTATTVGARDFVTTIGSDIITSKTEVTTNQNTDNLLIYRSATGLRKITRANFLKDLPTIPVGGIMPFAGATAPTGYLLCDGSERKISDYPLLFAVIGYTYGAQGTLVGLNTFKVPDIRGRFPLGKDDMRNGGTVPLAPNGTSNVDAGGGAANRVTTIAAKTLGNGGGNESVTLSITNVPNHDHSLTTDQGGNYYVFNNSSGTPGEPGAFRGNGGNQTNQSQYYNRTGKMVGAGASTQPFVNMNPHLTLNYIIYAGGAV